MTSSHPDSNINTREYAEGLDNQDSLKHLRDEFIIPTKADLKNKTLAKSGNVPPPPALKMLIGTRDSFNNRPCFGAFHILMWQLVGPAASPNLRAHKLSSYGMGQQRCPRSFHKS